MILSPGDSNNKSIIFTCGLGFLSGSEVLCVCVRSHVCVCVHAPRVWGALAQPPSETLAALQGENDQFESCQPGAAVRWGLGTYFSWRILPAGLLLAAPRCPAW